MGKRKLVHVSIFIALTLTFIITIKTIDIYNTRDFLYFSSFYYLSLNPYTYFPLPTPPLILTMLLPQFYFYSITMNLQLVSDFLRIINLIFSILSAILIMQIVLKFTNDEKKANAVFYALLFSPFIFFVNYIFNEQDILPIFLMLASFYMLYLQKNFTLKFAGALMLAYASFFYYFPILMIPTLLIYERNKKGFLTLSLLLFVGFSLFYTIFLKVLNWSILANGIGAIGTSASSVPAFSILNVIPGAYFSSFNHPLSLLNNIFEILTLLLVFTIPLLLKYLKKPIFFPLAIIFSIPFMLLKITVVDEFIWMLPFSAITIGVFSSLNFLKARLILIQFCFLPAFFVFNMYEAPGYGQGTGIFYLTYTQLHVAIALYSIIPNFPLVTKILDAIGFISIFLVIVYIVNLSRKITDVGKTQEEADRKKMIQLHSESFEKKQDSQRINEPGLIYISSVIARLKRSIRSISCGKENRNKLLALFAVFLLVWIFAMVPVSNSSERTITYSGGQFPLGYFDATNAEMNQTLSYNYANNGSFILLSNYTGNLVVPPMFVRNITNQKVLMNLTIIPQLPKQMIYEDNIAGFNKLNINIVNQLQFSRNYSYVKPCRVENLSNISFKNISLLGINKIPIISLNGTSIERYNSTILQGNTTYVLGFKMNPTNYSQNLFFSSKINGIGYEFFYVGSVLYFAYLMPNSQFIYDRISSPFYSSSWNVMSFSISNSSINFFLNGQLIYSSYNHVTPNSTGYVDIGIAGTYSSYENKFAFSGKLTPLIRMNSTVLTEGKVLDILYLGGQYIIPFTHNTISMYYNGDIVQIISNNHTVELRGQFNQFWFGRPSQYSPAVEYAFGYLKITTYTQGFLFYKMLVVLYGFPLFAVGVIIIDKKSYFRLKRV